MPKVKSRTKAEEEAAAERATKLAAAHNTAMQRLKDAHLDEYNAFRKEAAATLGIDWHPAPTKEEKAQAELERIYTEFPHLRPAEPEEEDGRPEAG